MSLIRYRGGPRHDVATPDTNPGQTVVAYDEVPPMLLGVPDEAAVPRTRRGTYADSGETDSEGNRIFRWQGWMDE